MQLAQGLAHLWLRVSDEETLPSSSLTSGRSQAGLKLIICIGDEQEKTRPCVCLISTHQRSMYRVAPQPCMCPRSACVACFAAGCDTELAALQTHETWVAIVKLLSRKLGSAQQSPSTSLGTATGTTGFGVYGTRANPSVRRHSASSWATYRR